MIVRRYITTASVICTMAFGMTGSAFATDVSIGQTGADSTQTVVLDNTTKVTTNNTNNVQVTSENVQSATTGDVSANKNTSITGPVGSGAASNSNTSATTVAITNDTASILPVGGSGNSGGSGNNGGSVVPVGGIGSSGPASGGSVLGAATIGGRGGGATLPEVGASMPVDVSALRAAWHPQATAPTANLAKQSRFFTGFMLLVATLLSVIGGLGSAWYARKREVRF